MISRTKERLFGGEYIDQMTQEISAGRFATVEERADAASTSSRTTPSTRSV